MKDLGKITKYLGVDFTRTMQGLLMHQHSYAQHILDDQQMADCRIEHTPLPDGFVTQSQTNTTPIDITKYWQVIYWQTSILDQHKTRSLLCYTHRGQVHVTASTTHGCCQTHSTLCQEDYGLWYLL